VERIREVAERVENVHLKDKSKVFNTARVEALELANLIEVARATMVSAEARKESRGAHAQDDFEHRDDENWLRIRCGSAKAIASTTSRFTCNR
jgi:succinate dehydrogenase / fumarate reductase flavoprotein subunit